jgi:3-oxocholest-4-en-26-oyl-CoA dehydrogenase beta subunit
MDFEQTPEGTEAAELAGVILEKHCTAERLKEIEAGPARFDHELWRRFADSGLIALTVPEEHNGSGLGMLELASVLIEVGRKVAPLPLGVHAVTSMAIAAFGNQTQQARWLAVGGLGEFILTTALSEDRLHAPENPVTRADNDGSNWLLTGSKQVVPSGPLADLFIVPAETSSGLTVFLVHCDDPGVAVVPQNLSGREVSARLELDRASVPLDRVLGTIGEGAGIVEWLHERLTVAVCAEQLGVLEGALALTSEYAKTREQFGRPIGTFQAVSQRLADGYIDVLGARLTMWQAAWLLNEALPATREIAVAKLWAADAGHRIAHTTVHVHGGVGIDMDGEAHRYFTAAKRLEFALGGTTDQARLIGALLAGDPS